MVRVDEVLRINIQNAVKTRCSHIYAHEKQQNTTPNNLPSNKSYQLLIAQCQESDYCRAGRSNKSFGEFS